jgi:hypothetical protein
MLRIDWSKLLLDGFHEQFGVFNHPMHWFFLNNKNLVLNFVWFQPGKTIT